MSILRKFDLTGKKALVTGGGRGIGRAFCLALAEAGADVAVVDINEETAQAVAQEVRTLGREGLAIHADVTVAEQVQRMVDQTVEAFGRLDIDVNNAGMGSWAPAEDMSEEDWDKVVTLNLKGVFLCAQACGRVMIKQGKGKIINTASMSASIVNRPQKQVHYNSSKAGVVMLTKSMAAEWAPYNINVNCISPGYTLTYLTKQVSQYHDLWKELTPMGCMLEPEDLQGVLIFLASEASDLMTGQDLIVDAGYTLW